MPISPDKTQIALTRLSVGLIQQHSQSEPISLLNPYLKQAWEYVCLCAYLDGVQPPDTLEAFVRWMHQPVELQGSFGAHCAEINLTGPILHNGELTSPFRALSERVANTYKPHLEMEDAHFRQIFEWCRENNDSDSYRAIRTFLVRNPIHADLYGIENPPWDYQLTPLFFRCYEPIPRAAIRSQQGVRYIVNCPHCGWPLRWDTYDDADCHPDGVCGQLYDPLADYDHEPEAMLLYHDELYETKAGIQRFVVAPEIALMELADVLQEMPHLQVELYPGVDSYDMLLTFPDGQRWAVDVKDWESAVSLAIGISEIPFSYRPPWDRAFYVFPDYRATPSYLNEFDSYWNGQSGVTYAGMRAFLKQVRKAVQ